MPSQPPPPPPPSITLPFLSPSAGAAFLSFDAQERRTRRSRRLHLYANHCFTAVSLAGVLAAGHVAWVRTSFAFCRPGTAALQLDAACSAACLQMNQQPEGTFTLREQLMRTVLSFAFPAVLYVLYLVVKQVRCSS